MSRTSYILVLVLNLSLSACGIFDNREDELLQTETKLDEMSRRYEDAARKYNEMVNTSHPLDQATRDELEIGSDLDGAFEEYAEEVRKALAEFQAVHRNDLGTEENCQAAIEQVGAKKLEAEQLIMELETKTLELMDRLRDHNDPVYQNDEKAMKRIEKMRKEYVARGKKLAGMRELLDLNYEQLLKMHGFETAIPDEVIEFTSSSAFDLDPMVSEKAAKSFAEKNGFSPEAAVDGFQLSQGITPLQFVSDGYELQNSMLGALSLIQKEVQFNREDLDLVLVMDSLPEGFEESLELMITSIEAQMLRKDQVRLGLVAYGSLAPALIQPTSHFSKFKAELPLPHDAELETAEPHGILRAINEIQWVSLNRKIIFITKGLAKAGALETTKLTRNGIQIDVYPIVTRD